MEAQSEYVHVAHTFWHVLAPTCMLSRCLSTKISASELRRKFIKSALLVGEAAGVPTYRELSQSSTVPQEEREDQRF